MNHNNNNKDVNDEFDKSINVNERIIEKKKKMLVTGHHYNDEIETVFMKLLRGVHLSQIKGIDVYSKQFIPRSNNVIHQNSYNNHNDYHEEEDEDDGQDGIDSVNDELNTYCDYNDGNVDDDGDGGGSYDIVHMLRPFVSTINKSQLSSYLLSLNQEWKEDESNYDLKTKYKRNIIRNKFIPLLEELTGSQEALQLRISTLTSQSKSLRKWLEMEANKWEREHLTDKSSMSPPSSVSSSVSSSSSSFTLSQVSGNSDYIKYSPYLLLNPSWFLLPPPVQTEILYRYIKRNIKNETSTGSTSSSSSTQFNNQSGSISYFHIEEILNKLIEKNQHDLHLNIQWKYTLNKYYYIERCGDILRCINILNNENIKKNETNEIIKKIFISSNENTSENNSKNMIDSTSDNSGGIDYINGMKQSEKGIMINLNEKVDHYIKNILKLKIFILKEKNENNMTLQHLYLKDKDDILTERILSNIELRPENDSTTITNVSVIYFRP